MMADRASKRRKLSPPSEVSNRPTGSAVSSSSFSDMASPDNNDVELRENEEGDSHSIDDGEESDEQDFNDGEGNSDSQDDGEEGSEASELLDADVEHTRHVKEQQKTTHTPTTTRAKPSATKIYSKSFKTRVEELLTRIPVKTSKDASIEALLRNMKDIIEKIREQEPMSIDKAEKTLLKSRKIIIPFPHPKPASNAQYKLGFAKPAAINVVGSYALKTATHVSDRITTIDMVVTMPSSLFTDKDYLNHRYFHKRAYYLACIAAEIRDIQKSPRVSVKYTTLHGNPLLPVLLVEPLVTDAGSDFAQSTCDIRIIPAVQEAVFPLEKTMPGRNSVRSEGEQTPTPFYNASIRVDSSVTSYLKVLHGTAATSPAFKQACMLGRVWLSQRGLDSTLRGGGFGNFEWSALLAILLHSGGPGGKPVFLPTYDCSQLFRAAIQFLARRDLSKQPLCAFTENELPSSGIPMLFDGRRGLNVLYKMTLASYRALSHESQTSLRLLTNNSQDQYEPTFGTHVCEPFMHFDLVAQLPLPSLGLATSTDNTETLVQHKALDIHSVLTRGLGNRITAIDVATPSCAVWSVGAAKPYISQEDVLTIRLSLDAHNAARVVDRGPAVEESAEAASFKEFWGEKAELRRFKDGSIIHSVIWKSEEPAGLLQDICIYLIDRHFGQQAAKFSSFAYLPTLSLLKTNDATYRASFDQVQTAYKDLENTIRATKGLPLDIRSIHPSSPQLSSTSLQCPLESPGQPPADVVIQFEGNSRWPDDLRAVQMTKIAFLLKLSDLLTSSDGSGRNGLLARIGMENTQSEILNRSFLDLTYPSGASFRVRIHHEREQVLLEKRIADKTAPPPAREAAVAALADYKRTFIKRPLHTQALTRASTRHPALPGAVRLLKTWFASHLLAPHILSEVIELLAAHTFAHPQPWSTPATPVAGFLRTLHFIAAWDWANTPLIVDFSAAAGAGGMKSADYVQLRTHFAAWRAVDPALHRVVLVVATDSDADGATWTDGARPSRVVAARMTALARSACAVVRSKGLDLDLEALFKTGLREYDFLLHLAAKFAVGGANGGANGMGKTRYKNLEIARVEAGEDATPAAIVSAFVKEMQGLYSDTAVLFWDGNNGGDKGVIAGIWSPGAARRRWKVNLGYPSAPLEDESGKEQGSARLDRMAVLNEIARVGGDIIERIEVRSKEH
ncbi:hypothetical protein FH972_022565 [Carpinus fangiana]|uniref:U3 small nucleolar RNA-associated protein 22 n=1 Tax=Carpinus fangiana TaxID=176857 RepID=A0A5N6KSY0_9ROSI|nr:hypothetical protein FH972_022565 [Carpinus fangiana]